MIEVPKCELYLNEAVALRGVSFVVIARNERHGIEKCLGSLVSMPMETCEIVCVDSDSTDGTFQAMLDYASRYTFISVLRCRGHVNAAIARNVGLNFAQQELVCFCDGDCEFQQRFVREAVDMLQKSVADAVTGALVDVVYSDDYATILRTERRARHGLPRVVQHCGGNFIARRELLQRTGLWNEAFIINEDFEYTLRLSRHGRLACVPSIMALHHTQVFKDRTVRFLKAGYPMYFGMLLRQNWNRHVAVCELLDGQKGFIPGLVVYGVLAVGIMLSIFRIAPLTYSVALLAAVFVADCFAGITVRHSDHFGYSIRSLKSLCDRMIVHYLYPLLVAGGLVHDICPSTHLTAVELVAGARR